MDFAFTEEQLEIKRLARDFAEKEVRHRIREFDQGEYYPHDLVQKMGQLGFTGGVIPPKYGGSGMDFTSLTVMTEELARVCTATASGAAKPSCSVGQGTLTYGTEEQKSKYIAPMARGEICASQAVTEPHSGTDIVRRMETTAVRDGDDYIITGTKTWISDLQNAAWFVTFATLDKSLSHKGVCAFIIEHAWPGVSVHPFKNKNGARALDSGELILDHVRVPKENRVGPEYEGYKVLMCGTEIGRLACGARGVGAVRACLEESIAYAQSRVVFGQAIGRYQLIQGKIADMAVSLQAARMLVYRLAWLKDRGVERAQQQASMAKMYATDAAMQAAVDACQIHGAYSCSEEYNVGRYFRDSKFSQIYDGTNDFHRVIIAEWALGYRGG